MTLWKNALELVDSAGSDEFPQDLVIKFREVIGHLCAKLNAARNGPPIMEEAIKKKINWMLLHAPLSGNDKYVQYRLKPEKVKTPSPPSSRSTSATRNPFEFFDFGTSPSPPKGSPPPTGSRGSSPTRGPHHGANPGTTTPGFAGVSQELRGRSPVRTPVTSRPGSARPASQSPFRGPASTGSKPHGEKRPRNPSSSGSSAGGNQRAVSGPSGGNGVNGQGEHDRTHSTGSNSLTSQRSR